MKLYELNKGDKFVFTDDGNPEELIPITFDHTDGMYSVCYLGKSLVHYAAYAEVTKIEEEDDFCCCGVG